MALLQLLLLSTAVAINAQDVEAPADCSGSFASQLEWDAEFLHKQTVNNQETNLTVTNWCYNFFYRPVNVSNDSSPCSNDSIDDTPSLLDIGAQFEECLRTPNGGLIEEIGTWTPPVSYTGLDIDANAFTGDYWVKDSVDLPISTQNMTVCASLNGDWPLAQDAFTYLLKTPKRFVIGKLPGPSCSIIQNSTSMVVLTGSNSSATVVGSSSGQSEGMFSYMYQQNGNVSGGAVIQTVQAPVTAWSVGSAEIVYSTQYSSGTTYTYFTQYSSGTTYTYFTQYSSATTYTYSTQYSSATTVTFTTSYSIDIVQPTQSSWQWISMPSNIVTSLGPVSTVPATSTRDVELTSYSSVSEFDTAASISTGVSLDFVTDKIVSDTGNIALSESLYPRSSTVSQVVGTAPDVVTVTSVHTVPVDVTETNVITKPVTVTETSLSPAVVTVTETNLGSVPAEVTQTVLTPVPVAVTKTVTVTMTTVEQSTSLYTVESISVETSAIYSADIIFNDTVTTAEIIAPLASATYANDFALSVINSPETFRAAQPAALQATTTQPEKSFGVVAGVAVGGACAAVLAVAGGLFAYRRRTMRKHESTVASEEALA